MIGFKKWPSTVSFFNNSRGEALLENDRQCLLLAQQGNRSAFQRLLEKHYDTIYQVAYRYTGHSEDAEDITQDVCIKLADKISEYRAEAKFETWLYTIIMHVCLDRHRKSSRQQQQINSYLEYADFDREVNQENTLKIVWLYQQLAKLHEPFKETAFLVLAENLSHLTVSQILNCSEGTVSWRMHEVRKQLKDLVGSEDEG